MFQTCEIKNKTSENCQLKLYPRPFIDGMDKFCHFFETDIHFCMGMPLSFRPAGSKEEILTPS